MFQVKQPRTMLGSLGSMLELIFHSTVREIRKSHRNAIVGLLMNMVQALIFVGAFYLMFQLLGMRRSQIRGDFLLYIMSGVFLFLTHTKAMGAVYGSGGSTSAMLKHAPLNSLILIASAALGALYTQILSLLTILYLYHVVGNPISIDNPVGAMAMLLLAWFSGVAIGVIFLSIKPWFPEFTGIAQQIYARMNMIASGKMFVANATPSYILAMFDWNPLFHCIDQERGFVFVNYYPHHSNYTYPIVVSVICITIGLMAEFFTRKYASESWGAAR
jgi:ABC-type polysaccharide/polyol phosphate export permease